MSRSEAAFMGRMTARMTHEIKNILAILKESSGLMEDVLSMNRDCAFPHRDKIESSLTRIHEQIPRGVELLTQFNRLAHSMDEPIAEVEISDFLDHVTFLERCFARLKCVELQYLPADEPLTMQTEPFRLHWILSASIEYVLTKISEGSTIVLRTEMGEGGPRFRIEEGLGDGEASLPSCREELPSELAFLDASLKVLHIRFFLSDAPERSGVILELAG